MKTATILSINGGGIEGVAILVQLVKFEKIIKMPLHKYFEYIAGTSTGGIIATFLSIGYTASEILEMYTKYGDKIFHKEFLRYRLFRTKYNDNFFNGIIQKFTKGKTLLDTHTEVIIPAYNATTKRLKIFRSKDAKTTPALNFSIFDVVRATAAAPTYFKPHIINGDKYIDGGMIANNPAFIAFIEALKDGYEKVNILSFAIDSTLKVLEDPDTGYGIVGMGEYTTGVLLKEMDTMTDYSRIPGT